MTSGEWDLRALRALEEEEQALFQSITEPEQIQRTSSQLPPIAEIRSLGGSAPTSPRIPLPPGLTSRLSNSGTGATSTSYCSSSSSRESGSSSRRYHKSLQRHQQPSCKKSGSGRDRRSSLVDCSPSTSCGGGGSGGGSGAGSGSGGASTSVVPTGASTIDSNDMMAMMMFLSSATPAEVAIPAAGGTTASLIGTATSTDEDNDDDIITCRGIANKKSGCKAVGKGKSSTDSIDYELEDHIKHCSCSCNHMGYGNSMDYQV